MEKKEKDELWGRRAAIISLVGGESRSKKREIPPSVIKRESAVGSGVKRMEQRTTKAC